MSSTTPGIGSSFETAPWKHANDAAWTHRRNHLNHPRVAPLTRLVDTLRGETGAHVPWIDPFCGGIDATILLVLKRPGRLGATATEFLSLANGDATARNTTEVMGACNIVYADLVFWNAIPWSGDREEVVTNGMISTGGVDATLMRGTGVIPAPGTDDRSKKGKSRASPWTHQRPKAFGNHLISIC